MLADWPGLAPDRPADGMAPTLSDAELLKMTVMSALLAAAAWFGRAPGGSVPDADYADMFAPPGGGPAVAAGHADGGDPWHCRRCTITPTAGPPRRSASACGGRWPAGWRSMTTVSTRHRWCAGGTGSPARSARTGSTARCGRSWRKQAVLQGRRCRAVDSTILADAVAAQGSVTQLVSATEWALTAGVPGWRRGSGGTRCRDGMGPLRASMR